MRARGLWITLAVTAATVATAAGACSRKSAGGLVVDPDPMDYGVQPWGTNPEMDVAVTNRSDHAVTFADPTFDCSCFAVVVPPSKARLEPGDTVRLRVVMRTKLKDAGRFHKTMKVVSDDPARPKVDVPIIGDVVDYRTVTPSQVTFGAVAASSPEAQRVVEVRGGNGSSVIVKEAVPDDRRRLSAEVRAVKGGSDVVLRVVPGAPKGRFSAQVRILVEARREGGGDVHEYSEVVWVTGDVE